MSKLIRLKSFSTGGFIVEQGKPCYIDAPAQSNALQRLNVQDIYLSPECGFIRISFEDLCLCKGELRSFFYVVNLKNISYFYYELYNEESDETPVMQSQGQAATEPGTTGDTGDLPATYH